MRRNTYLAALLLLSPCIALAQSVPPPSVPPNAASWGYTTLAFNSDFTQRLPTNWLGGCPNGADGSQAKTSDDTGHVWWNNIWWSKSYAPCDVAQVYDPVYGGLVLDIPWTVDTATAYIAHSIQTASWDYNGGNVGAVGASFPNSAYYEFTAITFRSVLFPGRQQNSRSAAAEVLQPPSTVKT